MKRTVISFASCGSTLVLLGAIAASPSSAQTEPGGPGCDAISNAIEGANSLHTELQAALNAAVAAVEVGLNHEMWGTIVDEFGIVCAVAHTGMNPTGDQWLGSRVISAQKANTGNSFSLSQGLALSSANLWAATQPGGSLFGLQHSNPVDARVAYGDNADAAGEDSTDDPGYGTADDPMVGTYIGGINVFGGGFPLYDPASGDLLGGLGVSGDTSCADHVIGWITRFELNLDNVTAGVSPTGDDNIIFDVVGAQGNFASQSGFGHPTCGFGEEDVAETLPANFPTGL